MSWETKYCFLPRVIPSYWPFKFNDSHYCDFIMIVQLAYVTHVNKTQDRDEFIYRVVRGKHTEWHCPSGPDTIVTIHVSYFTTRGLGKEHRTNKPLPTGRTSVQFSRSVVSDSLRPHQLQHARPPCPSPTPRIHSDPRPSSQWCHPAISSSVVPFSSCP